MSLRFILSIGVLFAFASPGLAQSCGDGEFYNEETNRCEPGGGGGGGDPDTDGSLPRLIRFLTPEDGASFTAGTTVAPTGRSSLSFAQAQPLDVTILLDKSLSMAQNRISEEVGGNPVGTPLFEIARQAVSGLVSILPEDAQVTLVTFGERVTITSTKQIDLNGDGASDSGFLPFQGAFGPSGARLISDVAIDDPVRRSIQGELASLLPDGRATYLLDAMRATQEFLNKTVSSPDDLVEDYPLDDYDREIFVLSDGLPTPSEQIPTSVDGFFFSAYGDLTTVALPGISQQGENVLSGLTNFSGRFLDFSDDPQTFLDTFLGNNGLLAGLTGVDITDPDGNTYAASIDALGNFTLNDYTLKTGDNLFSAKANFNNGTEETVTLNLVGTSAVPAVPLPGGAWLLLGALGALAARRR